MAKKNSCDMYYSIWLLGKQSVGTNHHYWTQQPNYPNVGNRLKINKKYNGIGLHGLHQHAWWKLCHYPHTVKTTFSSCVYLKL